MTHDPGGDGDAPSAAEGSRRAGEQGARSAGRSASDAVELAVRARPQRRVQPVLELLGLEPSLARGLAQPLRDRLAVGVRGSE